MGAGAVDKNGLTMPPPCAKGYCLLARTPAAELWDSGGWGRRRALVVVRKDPGRMD
jgi:hypothetical protein